MAESPIHPSTSQPQKRKTSDLSKLQPAHPQNPEITLSLKTPVLGDYPIGRSHHVSVLYDVCFILFILFLNLTKKKSLLI